MKISSEKIVFWIENNPVHIRVVLVAAACRESIMRNNELLVVHWASCRGRSRLIDYRLIASLFDTRIMHRTRDIVTIANLYLLWIIKQPIRTLSGVMHSNAPTNLRMKTNSWYRWRVLRFIQKLNKIKPSVTHTEIKRWEMKVGIIHKHMFGCVQYFHGRKQRELLYPGPDINTNWFEPIPTSTRREYPTISGVHNPKPTRFMLGMLGVRDT